MVMVIILQTRSDCQYTRNNIICQTTDARDVCGRKIWAREKMIKTFEYRHWPLYNNMSTAVITQMLRLNDSHNTHIIIILDI